MKSFLLTHFSYVSFPAPLLFMACAKLHAEPSLEKAGRVQLGEFPVQDNLVQFNPANHTLQPASWKWMWYSPATALSYEAAVCAFFLEGGGLWTHWPLQILIAPRKRVCM